MPNKLFISSLDSDLGHMKSNSANLKRIKFF